MSLKSSTVTDTNSKEFVEWMSAVWKANDLRNQLLEQLKVCEKLKVNLN
jgi:hypothetical protein